MKNELTLQKALIKAVEQLGGAGEKISNRFARGVMDLLLHVPQQGTFLVEVKYRDLPSMDSTRMSVELTPLQSLKLKYFQSAGAQAGLLICAREDRDVAYHFLSTRATKDHDMPTKKEFMEQCLTITKAKELYSILQRGLFSPLK